MGRTCSILGISLTVGAIASVLSTSSAQFPSAQFSVEQSYFQPTAPVKASVQKSLPLEHLIGIAQFVKNPTDYRLACGETIGQVTSASLEGDHMVISYVHSTADNKDGGEVGKLVGTLDSKGIFRGVFEGPRTSNGAKADAIFAFHADGTAKAVGGKVATTHILL